MKLTLNVKVVCDVGTKADVLHDANEFARITIRYFPD